MWYVIDGYNVIKQYSSITNRKLVNGKLSFLKLLERKFSRKKVTVVFDGFPKMGSKVYDYEVDVRYSRENTADEYIIDLIKNKTNKEKILLVTDDRDLIKFSEFSDVQVNKVEEFLKKWYNQKNHKRESSSKPNNLSLQGREITKYLYRKLRSDNGKKES